MGSRSSPALRAPALPVWAWLCRTVFLLPDISCWGYFFFFQAEDGIRDGHVTGVQTCALPISTLVLEWLNSSGECLVVHSNTSVGDRYPDIFAGLQSAACSGSSLGPDRQRAA